MRWIGMVAGVATIGGTLAALLVAANAELKARPRQAASGQSSTEAAPAERLDDQQAIRQIADSVAKAYNAKDGQALAALFTADAEVVDAEGHAVQGADAIGKLFATAFKQYPQASMEIEVERIRFLGPTAAVEEGISRVKHTSDADAEPAHYRVMHVKQDGQWLMASAQDLVDDEATAATELERLGWLVGTWVDEGPEALVTTRYQWADNQKYLVGEFTMQVHGRTAMTGTERIGWDPLAKKLRSWVFDSDGGFAEGLWTRQGEQWVLKLSGVTRDGRVGSATNVYTWLGVDKYAFESRDRVVGGKLTENTKPTTIVREPPRPGQ